MPQHRGGGIVHGPTPRDYSQRTPKKMIHLALLGAISDRARANRVHVVTSFVPGDAPSTKTASKLVADLTTGPRVLVVVMPNDVVTEKSVRNIIGVHTITAGQLNAYDVLHADDIIFTQAAYDTFVAAKTTKEVSA
jgi:large subunit ribosomal protein L4